MNTPIHDFLADYASKNMIRCHMPGGNGKNNPLDITEINGADCLYTSDTIIRESEYNASELFGSTDTIYSCSGSTLAIQTMLAVIREVSPKNTIIAGRYSHRSLISSCLLLRYNVKWAYPDEYLSCRISPEEIESLIDDDTAAVFVNSIDYYGGEADIYGISEVCKKHGVYLLVDNAHGAYKVFTENHPIKLGADMVADSAHKTLPVLTGGAYLHINDDHLAFLAKLKMALFGTSSPSYLIMDSLDLCNAFIAEMGDTAYETLDNILKLKKELKELGYTLKKSDDMRITVDTAAYGYTGDEFAQILRDMGAECEMADERYVVLLFSVTQSKEDLDRLYGIMKKIPPRGAIEIKEHTMLKPEVVMPPYEAYFDHPKKNMSVLKAVGKINAGIYCPCPPCVPLIMPGERVDKIFLDELLRYACPGIAVCDIE